MDSKGDILVDDFQNTSNPQVYAVGDVTGKWQLTPVAIAAGRKLAHRYCSRVFVFFKLLFTCPSSDSPNG